MVMEEDRNMTGCACDNMDDMNLNCPSETRAEMLKKIKCLKFAIIELALYLDTHPDDEKALCLHNKYCKELKDLEDKYQKVYGPLSIYYPCNKWRWLERTLALGRRNRLMWTYNKVLEYPVNIKCTDPRLAKVIISQYGGPDGELAASLRYLSQRFGMPDENAKAILNDIRN